MDVDNWLHLVDTQEKHFITPVILEQSCAEVEAVDDLFHKLEGLIAAQRNTKQQTTQEKEKAPSSSAQ